MKICFYFGYKIGILRGDGLKSSLSIERNPTNDNTMMKSFKILNLPFLSTFKTHFYNTSEFGSDVLYNVVG